MKFILKPFKSILTYFRFLVGGGLSLLLGLAITYILTEFFGIWHMLSFGIALAIEIIFLFLYHSVITFGKRGKFWLFIPVVLFISDLNWILVYVATIIFGWNYLISIIMVAGIVSVINFIMNKLLVFNKKFNKKFK
jgi:putative flippase GtrA